MRAIIKTFFAVSLMCMLLLTGCKPVPPLTAKDVEGYVPPDTETNGTLYYVYGSLLVGSWSNGEWHSHNDIGGSRENSYTFYLKDILSFRHYSVYSRDESLGVSGEMLMLTSNFIGGFPDDMTEKLAPYSEKIDRDYVEPRLFRLPVTLSSALSATPVPDRGFQIGFAQDGVNTKAILATNSTKNILPESIAYNGEATAADKEQIKAMLATSGITTAPNITEYIRADFNNDGRDEYLIVANSDYYELSAAAEKKEKGLGSYAIVLLRDSDGGYTTLYSHIRALGGSFSYEGNTYVVRVGGVYDLNGDGKLEICLNYTGWEWGHNFVMALDNSGEWSVVMRADYADL